MIDVGNERSRITKTEEVRVMFIGGPYDEIILPVPADEFGRPVREVHSFPKLLGIPHGDPREANMPIDRYHLHRVAGYPSPWWCYIHAGHTPTPSELVRANPGPFYRN
jgi:hypothetical protein